MVARPKSDRWHKKPTALLGGVAIFVAVVATDLALVPQTHGSLVLLGSAAWLFLVGLVDDVLCMKPYQKLIGQSMGAAAMVVFGLVLPWTGSMPLNVLITIFWLVGITNAVNLLDNMDGLAAGVAAIASAFLALNFYSSGQMTEALMLATFAAALVGFLVYNSNPASIFMGDCGSMFIGFFLAGAAMLHPTWGRSRTFLPVLAVPVLVLFLPIFDTFFVMILRTLAGRSVARGGRDHTSHRLVALGLSERRAVWMLYGLAATSGLLALMVRNFQFDESLAAILVFTLVLTLAGVHLAGVKVYNEAEVRAAREKPVLSFLVDLSYKRRVFEVCLDVLLIVLAYHTAHSLVFGPVAETGSWDRFLPVVAVLVGVKLPTFLVLGVYRGLWRYVSLDNLLVYAKAVFVGSVASAVVLLMLNRFQGISRAVIALDGLLLMALLCGSRLSFRLIRRAMPAPATGPSRRALIFGAGEAGVLLARELHNNSSLGLVPVGFVDDDKLKQGRMIHGLPVFDANGSFHSVCRDQRIDDLVISTSRITPERLRTIAHECYAANISVRRMRLQIELLDEVPNPGLLEPEPASV